MSITKESLLSSFDKLPNRYKALIILSIIFSGIYVMYSLILAPYLHNYFALRKELTSHQALLDSKLVRTKAIEQLQGAKKEYLTILSGINNSYFLPEESDLFIKSLPQIINGFGNDVSSLKPIQRDSTTIRYNVLKDYIDNLPPSKGTEEGLDYIESQQAEINSGDRMEFHLKELGKRIRRNKNDLRRVWVQAKDDPLSKLYMKQIRIELKFKGSYAGILHVLHWLKLQEKRMDIEDVYIEPSRDSSSLLDVHMFMSIYTVEEDLS